jgi:hypothetical protein
MYFPYFRGRQYELLALRDLAKNGLIDGNIIPVIEPVKLTTTLERTLEAFHTMNLPISLIYNPAVGDLSSEQYGAAPLFGHLENTLIIPSILISGRFFNCLEELEKHNVAKNSILAIMDNRDFLSDYEKVFRNQSPKYTLLPPDERRLRRSVRQGKVMFEDKFNKQQKNADYQDRDDEFFSEDHLYFAEEGYDGFGDYSIIGNDYSEKGFAPRAVAIHIVYVNDDNTLRIRHFTSDSNIDISDIAGKFYEAISKLYSWYVNGQQHQLTTGLSVLLNHYQNGTYPGLPTIKKLTIMHHLELVGKLLTGVIQV